MPKSIIHKGIIFTRDIYNLLESSKIDLVYNKRLHQIRIYIDYGDSCHDQYLTLKSIIDQANRQLHEGRIQDNYRNSHEGRDTLENPVFSTRGGETQASDPLVVSPNETGTIDLGTATNRSFMIDHPEDEEPADLPVED